MSRLSVDAFLPFTFRRWCAIDAVSSKGNSTNYHLEILLLAARGYNEALESLQWNRQPFLIRAAWNVEERDKTKPNPALRFSFRVRHRPRVFSSTYKCTSVDVRHGVFTESWDTINIAGQVCARNNFNGAGLMMSACCATRLPNYKLESHATGCDNYFPSEENTSEERVYH